MPLVLEMLMAGAFEMPLVLEMPRVLEMPLVLEMLMARAVVQLLGGGRLRNYALP